MSAFSLTVCVIEDCHVQVRNMSLADLAGEMLLLLCWKGGTFALTSCESAITLHRKVFFLVPLGKIS